MSATNAYFTISKNKAEQSPAACLSSRGLSIYPRFKISPLPHPIKPSPTRHGIALALIVKNEAHYLGEWIAFHCMLGVRHIYVYDNMSDDDVQAAVKQSTFADRVTVIRWGDLHMRRQIMAYNHCLSTYGMDYRWLGFLDADEFVFPLKSFSLDRAFKSLEHLPCIALHWRMFGTSGHKHRPEGLVIENYTKREQFPPPEGVKSLCKIFVDPSKVSAAGIHIAELSQMGLMNISQHGVPFDQYCERDPSIYEGELLRLHHYYTRSEEDFQAKLKRGGGARSTGAEESRKMVLKRYQNVERNPQTDLTAVQFAQSLKKRLSQSTPPSNAHLSKSRVA